MIIFILAISPSSISDYSCFMSNSLDYECFIIFVLNIQFTFVAPHLGTMAARLRFISALAWGKSIVFSTAVFLRSCDPTPLQVLLWWPLSLRAHPFPFLTGCWERSACRRCHSLSAKTTFFSSLTLFLSVFACSILTAARITGAESGSESEPLWKTLNGCVCDASVKQ